MSPVPRRFCLWLVGLSSILIIVVFVCSSWIPGQSLPQSDLDSFEILRTQISPARTGTQHESSIQPGLIQKNVATMIYDQPLEKIVPLVLHYSRVLGPDWPICLFTSQSTVPTSARFRRAFQDLQISFVFFPPRFHISHQRDLSALLTNHWFWEMLAPAEHVFVFQADSIVCANSPRRLNDFLQYDFIGAPINALMGGGFDGRVSLRNRSMMLDIIRGAKLAEVNLPSYSHPIIEFEDQWFYQRMKELPPQSDGAPGARLPSVNIAKMFSVETGWNDSPLFYQKFGVWNPEQLEKFDKWCPERKLATNDVRRHPLQNS